MGGVGRVGWGGYRLGWGGPGGAIWGGGVGGGGGGGTSSHYLVWPCQPLLIGLNKIPQICMARSC